MSMSKISCTAAIICAMFSGAAFAVATTLEGTATGLTATLVNNDCTLIQTNDVIVKFSANVSGAYECSTAGGAVGAMSSKGKGTRYTATTAGGGVKATAGAQVTSDAAAATAIGTTVTAEHAAASY